MLDTFALGSILYEVKHKYRLPRFDTRPEEFKERLEEVRLANDPMSSLISGLLEDLPHRLTIDNSLAQPWLNPTNQKSDEAILFFKHMEKGVDQVDDDGDGRMHGLDENLVSHTNFDEN